MARAMTDEAPAARRAALPARPMLPLWAALLVSAAGGLVLDAAYPALGWWPLAYVAVAMALVSLIGRSAWGALAVGGAFGAVFFFTHIIWLNGYLGPVPWIALAGVQTLFWALWSIPLAWAYRWATPLAARPWTRVLVVSGLVAAVWITRELFTGTWPYTGFPWARLGMSQSESPVASLASWIGVSGLGFVMVFFVAAIIEAVRVARSAASPRTRGGRAALVAPAAGALIVLLAVPQWPTTPEGTIRVGAVQGDGPAGYFDERSSNAILNAQLAATEPILDEDLDLLLWPEGGIDSDPIANPGTARVLQSLSARIDAPLVVNAATARGEQVFNTSMVWEPGATEPDQVHDKRMPVPFGEYVPDRWFYEAIVPDLIELIGREYTPGTNPPFFDVGGVGAGLAICFDVIYDEVIWEGARDGAQLYLFQTNNADFRGTDENLQQLAFARMRAIETGRSVVNLSTVGTSQVIAPDGATISALPEDEPGAMVVDVERRSGLTPAVVIGGVLKAAIGAAGVGGLVLAGFLVRRRRARETSALAD